MPLDKNRKLWLLETILATGIFITDLYTPRGIADGISYVALVIVTLWSHRTYHTYYAATLGTALTILGGLFSPVSDGAYIFFANRSLAIIGIWVAAFVILRFKNSQAESRRLRDSLNALFMYATEGIIISNSHGRIEMINPEAEKQFGYASGELVGETIEVLMPERIAIRHASLREGFMKSGGARAMGAGLELFAMRKDRTEFPVEISLSSYLLDGAQYTVAFVIDITERKKRDQQLKDSHEELKQYALMLKETNAELESFAYISSHDLQEPLRKIQSFGSRIMADPANQFSETSRDYMTRVLNAAARMQNLINDLLTFSRLTTRDKIRTEVDLARVAAEVLHDLEFSIEKSKATVTIDSLPKIIAEPTQMRQLFQNLISNAIKFRKPETDPNVHISCRKVDVQEREFIELSFRDNGMGFDEKYSEKIFGIFQRLHGARSEGSGIGLTICKKIVTRHGGIINVQSTPGIGTVFTVLLPVTGLNVKTENHATEIEIN